MEEEKAMEMSASANHADTVPRMFWHGVKTRAAKTIFRQKDFGIWQAVTWDELGRIAREIGMGLASLGYAPGEVVSESREPGITVSCTSSRILLPRGDE